jgi:hypothetical protein
VRVPAKLAYVTDAVGSKENHGGFSRRRRDLFFAGRVRSGTRIVPTRYHHHRPGRSASSRGGNRRCRLSPVPEVPRMQGDLVGKPPALRRQPRARQRRCVTTGPSSDIPRA